MGIWRLFSAVLVLGNIICEEALSALDDALEHRGSSNGLGGMIIDGEEEVWLATPGKLDRAARMLCVGSEDPKEILMTHLYV